MADLSKAPLAATLEGASIFVLGYRSRWLDWDERALIVAAVNSYDELREALRSVIKIAAEARADWDADRDSRVGKILIALSGELRGYRADIDAIHAALTKAEG